MRNSNLPVVALTVGIATSGGILLWAGLRASNEILFHGFAPTCSDGNPEFDDRYCGVTWGPGLPYLAVAGLALAIAVGAIWLLRLLTRRSRESEPLTW